MTLKKKANRDITILIIVTMVIYFCMYDEIVNLNNVRKCYKLFIEDRVGMIIVVLFVLKQLNTKFAIIQNSTFVVRYKSKKYAILYFIADLMINTICMILVLNLIVMIFLFPHFWREYTQNGFWNYILNNMIFQFLYITEFEIIYTICYLLTKKIFFVNTCTGVLFFCVKNIEFNIKQYFLCIQVGIHIIAVILLLIAACKIYEHLGLYGEKGNGISRDEKLF